MALYPRVVAQKKLLNPQVLCVQDFVSSLRLSDSRSKPQERIVQQRLSALRCTSVMLDMVRWGTWSDAGTRLWQLCLDTLRVRPDNTQLFAEYRDGKKCTFFAGRAGVPMEVMGLMLGEFVDDYTVRVVDVFAMPQSGTGVSVEAVDPVFQTEMLDKLKQTGRPEMVVGWYHSHPGFGCWLSGVDINTQQVRGLCERNAGVVWCCFGSRWEDTHPQLSAGRQCGSGGK